MSIRNVKNSEVIDRLIVAVQARECLWDRSYRGHRNRFKLERYWNEVASEVGTTTVHCRKKWKNLKDQCRKEMKKNPDDSDWQHFDKLKFIHNQFVDEMIDENGGSTNDDSFNVLDDIKNPKLGYTFRKKFLVNKKKTIDLDSSKLIELVKARDIIWNRQMKGHHNWYKLDECWQEISTELGVTRDEARLKWKYIRDQARKECRKEDSSWELLPQLQFLINQFNEHEGNDNTIDSGSYDYEMPISEEPCSFYEEPSEPVVTKNEEEDFDEFDRKPTITETDFYDDIDEPRTSKSDDLEKVNDEDVGFFNSLMPHIKKLPPAKKLMLRMKIQEVVYNTVYNSKS